MIKKTYGFFSGVFLYSILPLAVAEQSEGGSEVLGEIGGMQFFLSTPSMYALAAGLTIALAAFGGALAQSRVGAAAMEGIARNPQAQKVMFIPMIITLALIESFVIFSFAIAMIIAGKL